MAYPANGAQLLFESTSVSLMVSGTPAAVLPVLMLVRISLRTIPERVSTFTVWFDEFAFEPSAGYGPPVSCGISVTQAVVDVGVAGAGGGWGLGGVGFGRWGGRAGG